MILVLLQQGLAIAVELVRQAPPRIITVTFLVSLHSPVEVLCFAVRLEIQLLNANIAV